MKIICNICGKTYDTEDYMSEGYSSITECPYCRAQNMEKYKEK